MATDLHENISGTGLGILGGDFERKSLKTQIKIFGENRVALTELNIRFEQTRPEEATQPGLQISHESLRDLTERGGGAFVHNPRSQSSFTIVNGVHIQKFVFPFSDDKNCKLSFSCIF
jgi:hypothetical protein